MELLPLTTEYLRLYGLLQNPKTSKAANRQLLSLEQKDEIFNVALELLKFQQYEIHGWQLLSKKLNKGLQGFFEPTKMLDFIVLKASQSQRPNSMMMLCAAKIIILMGLSLSLKMFIDSLDIQLAVLKEIAAACNQIQSLKSEQLIKDYFQSNQNIVLQGMKLRPVKSIQCIQNFFEQRHIKLSNNLILQLMNQAPEEVGECIRHLASKPKNLKELRQEFITYLNKNLQHEAIFEAYIAFYQFEKLQNISESELVLLLQRLCAACSNANQISNTYEFWINLRLKFNQAGFQPTQNQQRLVLQAFRTVWMKLCQFSILKQVPSELVFKKPEVINLDDDVEIQEQDQRTGQLSQTELINSEPLAFRDHASDLFHVSFDMFSRSSELLSQVENEMLGWCTQSLNTQELVVFILESVCDLAPQSTYRLQSGVLEAVCRAQSNEYLLKKLIQLIVHCPEILSFQQTTLVTVLNVLGRGIEHNTLCALSCQTLAQIIECVHLSESKKLLLNEFLKNVTTAFLSSSAGQTAVANELLRAVMMFIHRFQVDSSSYEQFLQVNLNKLFSIEDPQRRAKYIENVFLAQVYLDAQSQAYRGVFSFFLDAVAHFVAQLCSTSSTKNEIKTALSLVLLGLKTKSVKAGGKWIQLAVGAVQLHLHMNSSANTLCVTLMKQLVKACILNLGPYYSPFKELCLKAINIAKQTRLNTLLTQVTQLHKQLLIADGFGVSEGEDSIIELLFSNVLCLTPGLEYDLTKAALELLGLVVQKPVYGEIILSRVLRIYSHLSDVFWQQVYGVVQAGFETVGEIVFRRIVGQIRPQLIVGQPQLEQLIIALRKSEGHLIRNLLQCLV